MLFGTEFIGALGSAGLLGGLDVLRGFFQPKSSILRYIPCHRNFYISKSNNQKQIMSAKCFSIGILLEKQWKI